MTRGHEKKCPRCSRVLPRSAFPLRKLGRETVASWCRECKCEYLSERGKKRQRKRPLPPSDSVSWCALCRDWRPRENFRAFKRSATGCYSYCKACDAERRRLRDASPSARANTLSRRRVIRAERPEQARAAKARRRARKRQAETSLTEREWRAILECFGHRCGYCNRKLAKLDMDHVQPLGPGPHAADNVVPACRSCNASKGSKSLLALLLKPHLLVTKRMTGTDSATQAAAAA